MATETHDKPPTEGVANLKLENGRGNSPTPETMTFDEAFKAFSKFGDSKSDGKHITLSQSDKWMKQAKVIDGKKITTTDTGICFKKLKSLKVGILDYKKFLEDLAKTKKIEVDELKNKMSSCGQPGHSGSGVSKCYNLKNIECIINFFFIGIESFEYSKSFN